MSRISRGGEGVVFYFLFFADAVIPSTSSNHVLVLRPERWN